MLSLCPAELDRNKDQAGNGSEELSEKEKSSAQPGNLETPEAELVQGLLNLHNDGSTHTSSTSFEHDKALPRRYPTPHRPPGLNTGDSPSDTGAEPISSVPIWRQQSGRQRSLAPNRLGHSTPNPRMAGADSVQHGCFVDQGLGRYDTSNIRGTEEPDDVEFVASHRQEPEIPMPPSAQPQRRQHSAPTRAPPSRLRYTNYNSDDDDSEDEDDDEQMEEQARVGVILPRVRSTDYHCSQDDENDERAARSRLSPTEMNSSTVRDPLVRSSTRRSNSHRDLYALRGQLPIQSTPTRTIVKDTHSSRISPSLPYRPSSFAVSDSEVPTQRDTQTALPTPATPKSRLLNTYSKSTSRIGVSRREILDPDNPAFRPGFRDQFSPEPEWESQQRRHRDGQEKRKNDSRSKRKGSTSFWPSTGTVPPTPDEDHGESGSWDDDNEEEEYVNGPLDEVVDRLPLSEVQINKKGRVVARGRGRNGEWPDGRDIGLFGQTGEEIRHREIEFMRPVTERLHLIREAKVEVGADDHLPRPRKEKERIKAFADPRHTHPIAKLKLTRSDSVKDRVDG